MNILVADDHEIMRDGIITILEQENVAEEIYTAKNGEEAIDRCEGQNDIDIIILDINMPNVGGIEAARKIKESSPEINIIALSMLDDEESIAGMLKAGASSFVLKSAGKPDLLQAIENIQDGKPFYSAEVAHEMMRSFSDSEKRESARQKTDLTRRELEIMKLIVEEHTNQEIAEELNISKRTVDTHRTNLLNKTGAKNTAGLVRYAFENNLV